MSNSNHCIAICNKLLRGERSAVETYDQAIEKFADQPVITELHRLRGEHSFAVSTLENNVRSMGGQPDESAGAWGVLANAVQGTANLFGASPALEVLQNGEKSGLSDYEDALKDEGVMPECKTLIRSELLPKITEHISALERLQDAA